MIELKAFAASREQFLTLVEGLRPELHRYCARMMGSAIDGEDVLQDTLARAYFQLGQSLSLPPLRPWLLRIAHNAAVDQLRRHERRLFEPLEAASEAVVDDAVDPATVRSALGTFLALPVLQRSAVILKDVLGLPNAEVAATLQTSVPAVKSALVRGRAALQAARAEARAAPVLTPELRAVLERYAERFNARDWEGLRTLLAKEVELDLVGKASRRGSEVGQYFGRYANERVTVALGLADGRPALGVWADGAATVSYVILLQVVDGLVGFIRDFRYVGYLASELQFVPVR